MSVASALKHELMRHDRAAPDEIGTDLDLTRPVLDDFGAHLGEQLNTLALRMISRGMFPSDGYSVAFVFDQVRDKPRPSGRGRIARNA